MSFKQLLSCALVGLTINVSSVFASELLVSEAQVAKEIKAFAAKMTSKGFDGTAIEKQLNGLKPRQDIIAKISKPAESLPWHRYQKIFLKDKRINDGVEFWNTHEQTLKKAEQTFGVDASIIVAIIGVETFYGRIQGDYPVIEALHTLGFYYPKRSKFFRSELEHYYQLAKAQNWKLNDIKGSYAGAMGMGQFISSSYRHYGYDFNQDGKVNLFNDPVDMIGSVANYFKKHHWKKGEYVIEQVVPTIEIKKMVQTKLKLTKRLADIQQAGATISKKAKDSSKYGVFAFEQNENDKAYWVAGDNFYSITRYNRSPLYALAVYQLSQMIAERKVNSINIPVLLQDA